MHGQQRPVHAQRPSASETGEQTTCNGSLAWDQQLTMGVSEVCSNSEVTNQTTCLGFGPLLIPAGIIMGFPGAVCTVLSFYACSPLLA